MKKYIEYLILALLITIPMIYLNGKPEVEHTYQLFKVIISILGFFTVLISFLKLKKHSIAGELWIRTVSFWWMTALFSLALSLHTQVIFLILFLLNFLTIKEFNSLMNIRIRFFKTLLYFMALALPFLINYLSYKHSLYIFNLILILIIPIYLILANDIKGSSKNLIFLLFGMIYINFAYLHFYYLVLVGTPIFVGTFFLTEIRDLISFWIGKLTFKLSKQFKERSLGHSILSIKVAQNVSPNKTWFVGIISSIICGFISIQLIDVYLESANIKSISNQSAFFLGFLIGIAGLFGDLFFSFLKRMFNVKDSGSSLPSGEGVLDRVDALLICLPVSLIYSYIFIL